LFGKQEYGGNLDQAVNAHFIELEANAYGIIFFNDSYICKKNHRYFILFYFISISHPQLSKKWIVHSVAVCFFFNNMFCICLGEINCLLLPLKITLLIREIKCNLDSVGFYRSYLLLEVLGLHYFLILTIGEICTAKLVLLFSLLVGDHSFHPMVRLIMAMGSFIIPDRGMELVV
jgi:hypothetical protein